MNEELSKLRDGVNQMDRVVVRYRARRIVLGLSLSVLLIAGCVFAYLDFLADSSARNFALLISTLLATIS